MGRGAPPARIITRGNLDGIVCAAVFLDQYPDGAVTFISSPPCAAAAASEDRGADRLFIADVPLTAELAEVIERDPRITLVDHHPPAAHHPRTVVDLSASAAGVLYRHLGASPRVSGAVVLADLYERSESEALVEAARTGGRDRIEAEARVLDFAWRYNVEDDAFRLEAARELSSGRWPSESDVIVKRYRAVLAGDRWNKAVARVREMLQVRGGLALLDLRRGRPSLHGFGSLALAEAARERGCAYAMLVHDSRDTSVASLRACGGAGVDLGQFAQSFARTHGAEGGGHQASAGMRMPRHAADLLIDELAAAVS